MSTLRDFEHKVFDKINPAINFSVRRYVMAIGIFAAIVAFGFISTISLGVDMLPNINIPVVMISTSYAGATPGVVDTQISQVIENAVSTLTGITDINSTSSQGSSRVTLTFDQDIDKNSAANQVSAIVASVTRRLPTGVNPPVVRTFDPNSQPIIQFGVASTTANLEEIGRWVDNGLAPLLERLDGVANIQIDGAPSRQFQVLVDPSRLSYYRLNAQQVTSAITGSSLNQPIGTIVVNKNALTFATNNQPTNTKQIGGILVDATRGISVADIADIRDVPVPSNIARINGTPMVLVSIQKTSDANSVAVVQSVRNLLAKNPLPDGYAVTISNDTTGPIRASVDSTLHELVLTALVVTLIVLMFVGKLNTALSVILAIPISLAASPILYNLAGFSFNLVSLLALITAIGIVVDDSIVVSENIERYRAMGYGLKESVLHGASEVFSAVVAASLSLLAVLLPVSFMGGTIGRYIQQFSLGLAAAVFFSLAEAILFLTVRLAYTPETRNITWRDFLDSWRLFMPSLRWGFASLRKPVPLLFAAAAAVLILVMTKPVFLPLMLGWPLAVGVLRYLGGILYTFFQSLATVLHTGTEWVLVRVREAYVHSMKATLRHAAWILIAVLAFFVATVVLVAPAVFANMNMVPATDNGTMGVSIRLPDNTPMNTTNLLAGRVEAWLLGQPEVVSVQTTIGTSGGGLIATNAQMTVQLVPIEMRPGVSALVTTYRRALQGVIADQPNARIGVSGGGAFGGGGGGGGGGNTTSFNIISADFDVLTRQNQAILAFLQSDTDVQDVTSSLSNIALENDFVPDPDKLSGTGLAPNTIATSLQTFTSGVQAANVMIGGISYPIQVMLDPTVLSGGQSLLSLPVYSSLLQSTLQMGQLGHFVLNKSPIDLTRYNRQYSASFNVTLKPNGPSPFAFQNRMTKELTDAGLLGGGVFLTSGGRFSPAALAAQLGPALGGAFALAMFLVYLVMGAQFNSWKYPVYLLLPVPLAIIGALWMVFIQGGGMDIFGALGMLMLIGLSAKNAIIYLDFVVERLGKMPFAEALIESARLRFRPIVMTTMTVLVISVPLIFGTGQGSEFGQKMGVVMFGGITSSALLTFFVVPAAFYLFERKKWSGHPSEKPAAPESASFQSGPAATI